MSAVFVHQRQLWNELPSTLKDNNITVEHCLPQDARPADTDPNTSHDQVGSL